MAAQADMTPTRLVVEAWRSGRRRDYLQRHPLTFPNLERRHYILSLGAKRADVNKGFDDPAAMRRFIRRMEEAAGTFYDEHKGDYVPDGK